ncbi:MAG: sugar phosphate isomerase/epimerase family protein [Planctomycetota bacterium]|jgi:sugar phosphate isomerase/epimerase
MGKATLSMNTGGFGPESLPAAIEWAARLGLAGVEVNPAAVRRSPEALAEARAAFERVSVRPLSMHAWTQVEGLDRVCPFVAKLGAGLIVVHCRDGKIKEDFDNQVAMLKHWDGWCRGRGIVLTVENSSIQPLEPFVRLFEALPDLRMTLDVKHAYKPEKLGLTHVDYMRELGDRAANFHISGIDRARDALGDGCPPGNDHVDWKAFADDLVDRDYAGLITVEIGPHTDLTGEALERAYFDLPPASPAMPTLAHRLTGHAVKFFRKELARVLR